MKTFKIKSGAMIISDPIYERDNWCSAYVSKVKNGVWMADIIHTADKKNIATLYAWNLNEGIADVSILKRLSNSPPLPYVCGVSSGILGYFDDKVYHSELPYNGVDILDTLYYFMCRDKVLNNPNGWENINGGILVSTAAPDGSYITKGLKNDIGEYIGFITDFNYVSEDNGSDNDDDEDDEDI